uniref:Long-chain-fatty-acid--CoA ligase n=1 Tax=Amphimedon queenslandica TaxID=400682 RepID=A0A1X7U298_AMPQE
EKTSSIGRHLESEMNDFPDITPTEKGIGLKDRYCYIFTSGTTGLPKAVICTGTKPMLVPPAFSLLGGMNDNDIVYVCLPLYHSTGSMIAMGQMTATGKTVVLSRKFSARNFWKDCIKHKCT